MNTVGFIFVGLLTAIMIPSAYYAYMKQNWLLLLLTLFYCYLIMRLTPIGTRLFPARKKTENLNLGNAGNTRGPNMSAVLAERLAEFKIAESLPPGSVADRATFKDTGFCPFCTDKKLERWQKGNIVYAKCTSCLRGFSNVGPIFTNGTIRLANYGEGLLKEMMPTPMEDILPPMPPMKDIFS